ncbi:hypothetical protein FOVSG1_005979 [Fusarium oxysporum f. sp. vasinfectum]
MTSRHLKTALLSATVESNQKVRVNGDNAVRTNSEKFDKWSPESFKLSESQIEEYIAQVPTQTIQDIKAAQANVRRFAEAQRRNIPDLGVEIQPGVIFGHKNNPINRVGAQVIACTPPIQGQLPNSAIAAAHFADADEIFILGGTRAIAAMAVGTETVKEVDYIAGPGNTFVAEAKRFIFGEIGIDLFAGPTETPVIADESADPLTVATALLSQAEHGPDSPAILITTSELLGNETIANIETLLKSLPTVELAGTSWRDYGEVVLVEYIDEAFKLADEYSSEHAQILTKTPRDALASMTNYGALFLGEKTTCIGTNHVLPTRKAGNYTGGVWVGKFLKTQIYQEILDEKASGEMGRLCGICSRADNFEGHARAGGLRTQKYLKDDCQWIKDFIESK